MIQITGLWKRQSKSGDVYYAGPLGNSNILIFTNKRKKSDKSPDLMLCIGEKSQQSDYNNGSTSDTGEDDIPF